jgi:ADP-ribose pyrophosphatase YjhB (NUDIX family)
VALSRGNQLTSKNSGVQSISRKSRRLALLVVIFLIIVIIVFQIVVAVFRGLRIVVFFVIIVIGNHVHAHRTLLHDFKIRLALQAAQDLALFYFVFVAVNFSAAFWATYHGRNLLPDGCCRASWAYYIPPMPSLRRRRSAVKNPREFPAHPIVGVGGVVIDGDSTLLIRRGHEPLKDQWSIPGGALELGETIRAGLAREMLEETGLVVRVGELIEVFERIIADPEIVGAPHAAPDLTLDPALAAKLDPKLAAKLSANSKRAPKGAARANNRDANNNNVADPRYHFVILDYLCEPIGGSLRAGSDVTDARFVREKDLPQYGLAETAQRVLRTAFDLARSRPKL